LLNYIDNSSYAERQVNIALSTTLCCGLFY